MEKHCVWDAGSRGSSPRTPTDVSVIFVMLTQALLIARKNVHFSRRGAMAEMADAPDLKFGDGKTSCGFESHSRYTIMSL